MIITINSDNPYLLDLLNKNPTTDFGLYVKPHRNGYLIGNAIHGGKYQVIFQDTKYSYGDESNQIDFMSMCSSALPMVVCKEFFSQFFKDDFEIPWLERKASQLDIYPCFIHINHIWIESNWIREDFLLSRYITGLTVKKEGLNLYAMDIEAPTTQEAINLLALVSFLTALSNDAQVFVTKELAVKYAKVLAKTSVPYFIYYLFIKRLPGVIFNVVKTILEEGYLAQHGETATFTAFDTHSKRIEFIRGKLDFSRTIVDYGCGEFRYTKAFSKQLKTMYSYDKDDYTELYQKLKERYSFEWFFTTSVEELPVNLDQVILSEVIEHIENPREVIDWILPRCKKLIITTPNKDFNSHYGSELRHEDHVKEYTLSELKALLPEFSITGIGDVINNEPITFAAIYEVD